MTAQGQSEDLPRISEKLHGKGDARPRSELIRAAPQWLRIVMQAAAAEPICSETAMLRIESSAPERHCRAEIYNAWAWKCTVPKSSGMAQPRHARQRNGIALRREASERIEARSNGYEMQANAMAPLNSASHRHCWEKRRHGQEAMGCERLGHSCA